MCLKTEIKKKYIPFITEWKGTKEYPKKDPVKLHVDCKNFDPLESKYSRRNVIVKPRHVACKFCKFCKLTKQALTKIL
jgi:hypothetical protein